MSVTNHQRGVLSLIIADAIDSPTKPLDPCIQPFLKHLVRHSPRLRAAIRRALHAYYPITTERKP